MAYQPMLRPDPSEGRSSELPDPHESKKDDPSAGLYLACLARTLAAHGGGTSSADLALELVLNGIVEQACVATTATGAAIALLCGGEMVCRATSGTNAPDLGMRLDMRYGLSSACVRTRQVQRCRDAETDVRVDSAASRTLEARSVLVVPVLDGEELIGVLETFSPRVNAFSERDVQALQALSRRIVHTVRRAAERISPDPTAESSFASTSPVEGIVPKLLAETQATAPEAKSPPRDHRSTLLKTIVLALALLLGWTVGRVGGWEQAKGGASGTSSTPKPRIAQPMVFDTLLTQIGVASPPDQAMPKDTGDPRVWVDFHKGLYYCSGDRHYGKTKDGQFTTLHFARISQYQPASPLPCQ
jgi:hypothetical protein